MGTCKDKILVIDDEQINLMALEDLLELENYQVITASDGYEGLKKIKTLQPDLVLLDIMMPGINGYEVLRKIRQLNELLPVIMLTAKSKALAMSLSFEEGANDFLNKPFDHKEILARIKVHLNTYKKIMAKKPSYFLPIHDYLDETGNKEEKFIHLKKSLYVYQLSFKTDNSHLFDLIKEKIFEIISRSNAVPYLYKDDTFFALIENQKVCENFVNKVEHTRESLKKIDRSCTVASSVDFGEITLSKMIDEEDKNPSFHGDILTRLATANHYSRNIPRSILVTENAKELFNEKYIRFVGELIHTDLKLYEYFENNPQDVVEQKLSSKKIFEENINSSYRWFAAFEGKKEVENEELFALQKNFSQLLDQNPRDEASALFFLLLKEYQKPYLDARMLQNPTQFLLRFLSNAE